MTQLTEGRFRRPMWAPGNVLVVPKDGPWAYLHAPGGPMPIPILVLHCEAHDDWEPINDSAIRFTLGEDAKAGDTLMVDHRGVLRRWTP